MDVNHADVPRFAIKPTEGDRYEEFSLLAALDDHQAAVLAVKLKDNVLVSGSGDRTMCIWSIQTGKILHKISIHQRGVACIQYSVRFIVSGSTDESVRIYDVDQEVEIACLKSHTDLVRSVQAVFDDNGEVRAIISGSYDGSIRVWKPVPGSQEWLAQHQFYLNGFQASGHGHAAEVANRFGNRIFSIDLGGNRLICSGQGPMIRVWDLRAP